MNEGRRPAAGAAWQDAGMGTVMLLDSASMYFRAFYGVPETMTAPDGMPVNAVRGFLDMITRLVRGRRPAQLIACMDASWRPAFRVAAIPSYKAHRANPDGSEQVPPALNAQIPVITDVLAAAGVKTAGATGYEADDIIGTLAAQADQPVEVVTGDRDLFQVVDDSRGVRVAYIGKGVANLQIMDEAAITAKYRIQAGHRVLRRLAGRPERWAPRRARRGGEDGGGPDPGVRLGGGHPGRPRWGPRRIPRREQGEARRGQAVPGRLHAVVSVATDAPVSADGGWLPSTVADPARVAAFNQR